MSLIRIEKVTKRYQTDTVLEDVDFRVEEGEKIGLIGRNGSGKSTLFRLMTGEIEPDGGVVERMRRARVACLAQLPDVAAERTVYDVVHEQFAELIDMEKELQTLEGRMAEGDDSVLERYGELQEAFTIRGGYEYPSRVKQVLTGLGFLDDDFSLPFKALSGGQRTRLMLALVLLADADLLLLDEPENHLDLQAREWLESFLQDWQRAFVIISHDREMLDAVTERIVEVEFRGVRNYTGNYSAFKKAKTLHREQHEAEYRRQQEFIEKEESWINRFRYKATKAKQVQSRIKRLEKLELVDAPPPEHSAAKFGLGEVVRSGQSVLEARGLSMGYPGLQLYSDVDLTVERGERVGIIGPNGAGKTTILRHLAGRLNGGNGEVRVGHKVRIGWYDQQHEDLNTHREMLEDLEREFPNHGREALRSFMGRFLFRGDDVFKKISDLSGGERSRVAMAKLILGDSNLLMLDEPTNHLDIASREALEAALMEFPGTIVMVSHDRALIDKLADKLLIVSAGTAEVFLGNYSDYRWRAKEEDRSLEDEREVMRIRKETTRTRTIEDARPRDDAASRKRLKQVEARILELEEELTRFDQAFEEADPTDYERLAELTAERDEVEAALAREYEEWERLGDSVRSI
jgi:ATP-binding cassette, subfamily F, member 3